MGYERKTPIVRGTRVIARHVHLATTSEESVLDFRVDTQYWDYCVDRERLLMECERAPQLKRFIPDLCLPPVSESDDDESPGDAGNGDARDNGGNDGAGGGAGAGDGAGYDSAEPSKDSGADPEDGRTNDTLNTDSGAGTDGHRPTDSATPDGAVLASKSEMLHRYSDPMQEQRRRLSTWMNETKAMTTVVMDEGRSSPAALESSRELGLGQVRNEAFKIEAQLEKQKREMLLW